MGHGDQTGKCSWEGLQGYRGRTASSHSSRRSCRGPGGNGAGIRAGPGGCGQKEFGVY